MRKRLLLTISIICFFIFFLACRTPKEDSTFNIMFIDVGQGDSALIECDGHYMLIDGGNSSAGKTVYNVLENNPFDKRGIQKLDILAISHMHEDHIGGLPTALTYASSIDLTISNKTEDDSPAFRKLESQLIINGAKITVPTEGDVFELGSARVEVLDASAGPDNENDSLVLLVSYGNTRFLFTGDIEDSAQKRLIDKYKNEKDEAFKIDLLKMPHHGADSRYQYQLLRTFMPTNVVISVGPNNYGHPKEATISRLKDLKANIYRTDENGNIKVSSDGKKISISTDK